MFLYPWKIVATFENHPEELYFSGNNEAECMADIVDAQEKYGKCTYYSLVDDDYYVDDKYIGRENFIYN